MRDTNLTQIGLPLAGWFLIILGVVLTGSGKAGAQSLPDYNLQPGDQLEVTVWGEAELQRIVLLRPDGKFAFPLAGEIDAAGKTTSKIQAELTEKLLVYIPEAVVTVSVIGIEGNGIYVIGQVQRPGRFVMNPSINVLQALSLAGGTTAFAALNDIIVIRGSGVGQRVLRFAYNEVKKGRNLDQNIQLESGDVVIVP